MTGNDTCEPVNFLIAIVRSFDNDLFKSVVAICSRQKMTVYLVLLVYFILELLLDKC